MLEDVASHECHHFASIEDLSAFLGGKQQLERRIGGSEDQSTAGINE
jgi:hypothetical protein